MFGVRGVESQGISKGLYYNNWGFGSDLNQRGLRCGISRHRSIATTPRLPWRSKGEHSGNHFHLMQVFTMAAGGMGDPAEGDDTPEKAPSVRPAKFEVDNWDGEVNPYERVIYPYQVENQKLSVIAPGGDYTFMRNTVPITDGQPNVPSAMFLAKEDRKKAEAEYAKAIYTVQEKNSETYKKQFKYTSRDKLPPIRVFGVGLPLFSSGQPMGRTRGHQEFRESTLIEQFDFVGASKPGNQPAFVPGGRGGYVTDGAMFASRLFGVQGGLANVKASLILATYEPDAISQEQQTSLPDDRLFALRWALDNVIAGDIRGRKPQTALVAIVYDPDKTFTAEEEACIKELLEPKAPAVVFLIPKDEPVDMATDQRYATMRSLQGAGALVVSSVDGDYLRTPLTKAGWGLFDYNVIVGDTEAPEGSATDKWQLVEGTSITAAAAGCAACLNVMHLLTSPCASPRVIKKILSAAAVDLNQVLTPKTIADLEAYRDQCIDDCGLTNVTSSPNYQSMFKGLAVDAKILRFNKEELTAVYPRMFTDALVGLADARAATGDLLVMPEYTEEEARRIAYMRLGPDPRLGVSDLDLRTWIYLINAAKEQTAYADLAETADTLAGGATGYNVKRFATAICEAREVIKARGIVGEDMQWVLGLPDLKLDSIWPGGEGYPGQEGEVAAAAAEAAAEAAAKAAAQANIQRLEKEYKLPAAKKKAEGQPGAVEGGTNKEVSKEVQEPPTSELKVDEQLEAAGQEGAEQVEEESSGTSAQGSKKQEQDTPPDSGLASIGTESQRGAANGLLGGEEERSWAGLFQYFVDLITDKQGDKEGLGKQAGTDEGESLSNMTGAEKKRTWVGLIKYLIDLLKKGH